MSIVSCLLSKNDQCNLAINILSWSVAMKNKCICRELRPFIIESQMENVHFLLVYQFWPFISISKIETFITIPKKRHNQTCYFISLRITFSVKKTELAASEDKPEPSELRSNFSLTMFTKDSELV